MAEDEIFRNVKDIYSIEATVGRGGASRVFRAVRLTDNLVVALKQIRIPAVKVHDEHAMKKFRREADLMTKVSQHPFIVDIYTTFKGYNFVVTAGRKIVTDIAEPCLYIEMEFCDGGTLFSDIEKRSKMVSALPKSQDDSPSPRPSPSPYYDEARLMLWFKQLSSAVAYIHEARIIHRDIKSLNIFLSSDHSTVKLGDFGIARMLTSHPTEDSPSGTIPYMAPETFNVNPDTYKADFKEDVWSLGVVLYEMATLSLPFRGSNAAAIISAVLKGKKKPLPFGRYTERFSGFIDWILNVDRDKRPFIEQISRHPYFRATTGDSKLIPWQNQTLPHPIYTSNNAIQAILTENDSLVVICENGDVICFEESNWNVTKWQSKLLGPGFEGVGKFQVYHAVWDFDWFYVSLFSHKGYLFKANRQAVCRNTDGQQLEVLVDQAAVDGRQFFGLSIARQNRLLFACDYAGKSHDITIWSTVNGNLVATIPVIPFVPRYCDVYEDGEALKLAVTDDSQYGIYLYKVRLGRLEGEESISFKLVRTLADNEKGPFSKTNWPRELKFDQQGKLLLVAENGSNSQRVRAFDADMNTHGVDENIPMLWMTYTMGQYGTWRVATAYNSAMHTGPILLANRFYGKELVMFK